MHAFSILCMKEWDTYCTPKYHEIPAKAPGHSLYKLWASLSFHGTVFLLARPTDSSDCSYSDLRTWQIFLKNKQCKLVTLRKTTDSNCCQCLNLNFQQNSEVWQPCSEVDSVVILKGLLCHEKINIRGDIIECDFILYNNIC